MEKPAPLYAVLIGNASWDPLKLLNTSNQNDFVPTYGFPVSDVWFSLLDSTKKIRIWLLADCLFLLLKKQLQL